MFDVNTAPVGRTFTGVTGLYLLVTKRGHRRWIFRYSRPHKGGVNEMSLGPATNGNFQTVLLQIAQIRALLAEGKDPVAEKRVERRKARSFSEAATGYIEHNRAEWSASQTRIAKLYLHVYGSALSRVMVPTITEDHIVAALKPLWDRRPGQARRCVNMWSKVLVFAGRGQINPASWKGTLQFRFPRQPRQSQKNHAMMDTDAVPYFIAVLRPSQVHAVGAVALEFCILTATRTSETLGAQWSEIDWANKLWNIPAKRMKTRKPFRVPLTARAIELLKRQYAAREGSNPFVFTGYLKSKSLTRRTMLPFIREHGDSSTVHGFRASFKTWATEETNYPREIVEWSLAHTVGGMTEQAYQRGDVLAKRRKLMEAWEDHCLSEILPDDISGLPDMR
jgi:integrase